MNTIDQIIYALERAASDCEALRDKLMSQSDYSAQFPASDAECIRDAIKLLHVHPAVENIGKWLSAAIDDPHSCAEFKADIAAWFEHEFFGKQCSLVPNDLIEFLQGKRGLNGLYFGDTPRRGAYWWRERLPKIQKEHSWCEGLGEIPTLTDVVHKPEFVATKARQYCRHMFNTSNICVYCGAPKE